MKNNILTPLELYIHIPFCIKKCLYCDFLSGPSDEETRDNYVKALIAEIKNSKVSDEYQVTSVFIGGGTPSILKINEVSQIMNAVRDSFNISDNAEITIEANPGTVDKEKLCTYLDLGINRLSLGLQSTNDDELRTLGRIHSYEVFLESYRMARDAGFRNINIDLMFAIPGQTRDSWKTNLISVAGLEPEHISAYSLIVEEGTPFYEMSLDLADEDTEYMMYDDVAEILGGFGYCQYEISNYSKPGFECRHNIGYWKRTEYLGFGLGAASLFRKKRFTNTTDMDEYLKDSADPDLIRRDMIELKRNDEIEEFMYLGLRMTDGISGNEFENKFGVSPEDVYGKIIHKYESAGFLTKTKAGFKFTRQGIHVSNSILADFLLD